MKNALILTGFLVLAALPAHADTPATGKPPTRQPFGTGELPEVMKPFDVNADGKLSAEERQAFETAMKDKRKEDFLKKFDTNGDGVLSDAELKAARDGARQKIEDHRGDRFDELDKDKDGFLSEAEFAPPVKLPDALVKEIFTALDSDKDGKISKAEFLAGCRGPIHPPEPGPVRPGPKDPPVRDKPADGKGR